MDIDLTWIVGWLSHNYEHRDVILDMVFLIYCDYICGNNGYKKPDQNRAFSSVILGYRCSGKDSQAFRECICVQETNINGIEYNHDKLYSIARKVGKDPRYKLIDRSDCTRIRKLHQNKRGKGGGKRLKHHTHRLGLIPEGVNSSNLIHIKMDTSQSMRDLKLNLTLSLFNAQSIKNKELVSHGQLIHHNVDICILIETWLSKNDLDITWLQYTVLNKVPYQMLTSNRIRRRGGGVALIVKSHLRVKQIGEGQLRSFQFCKWQVQVHHTSITLVSIYHPPYNTETRLALPFHTPML